MSVLVVGMSHKSAPLEVLERVSLELDAALKLSQRVLETPFVEESVVISTCNRVEIYVEAERFHGSVEEVSRLLAEHAELDRDEFVKNVYVHFDEAAVAHLFAVAAGLDSMILGEGQILGQVRDALQSAQNAETVGPALNTLFQQALRIGKRGHAETDIDRLAPSVATAALDAASPAITPTSQFLVAGAGAMATLAVHSLVSRGIDPQHIVIANRTLGRADEIADTVGVRSVAWSDLDIALAHADVLVSCTGSREVVFDEARVVSAVAGRELTIIDLALPRDVAAGVADLPGVEVIDLVVLNERAENATLSADVDAVRAIVDEEVRGFLAVKAATRLTPTIVALRSMATDVVEAEVARVVARRADLSDADIDTIRQALQRVADKLIHAPTVRVQELGEGPSGLTYADALADLFAIDPSAVAAVTQVGGETS